MLGGQSTVSLDVKGRISVPSQIREGLKNEPELALHVTVLGDCLVAYSVTEWEKLIAGLNGLSKFNEQFNKFRRKFYSPAARCEINKAGRMLIPQRLREKAGLKRDVVVAGVGAYVEIWDAEKFEGASEMSPEEMSSVFKSWRRGALAGDL
jgi:MraZ protein